MRRRDCREALAGQCFFLLGAVFAANLWIDKRRVTSRMKASTASQITLGMSNDMSFIIDLPE